MALLLLALALAAAPAATEEREAAPAAQGGRTGGAEEILAAAIAAYSRAMDETDHDLRLEAFHRAERLFRRVTERGVHNADLYANLGNAALQAERLGAAVLAYRRALLVDPDHPRARQNLAHARSLLPRWVPRPAGSGLADTFFFWHRTLSRSERAALAAFCFAVAGAFAALALTRRWGWARLAAILTALCWLALVASLLAERKATSSAAAVITAEEVIGRAADSLHAPSRLPDPLPAGTEVRVAERRDHWVRVRLADGREAWVGAAAVTPVRG